MAIGFDTNLSINMQHVNTWPTLGEDQVIKQGLISQPIIVGMVLFPQKIRINHTFTNKWSYKSEELFPALLFSYNTCLENFYKVFFFFFFT